MAQKGNILKVIELGIQDRVFDAMKQPRFSVEALTRKLNSEGISITAQSIRKFIKKSKKAQQELIKRDLRTSHEIQKITLDYTKTIKAILDEVKEVKDKAREEQDMATYNQLVGRLYQGLELIAKLTGDIKPRGSTDIKIIYNEINANIEKNMRDIKKEMFEDRVIDVDYEIEKEDTIIAKRLREADN